MRLNPRHIEAVINRLPSVEGSVVVLAGTKEIREIHVLASSDLPPNKLVRHIQAAVQAEAQRARGQQFDPRRISLVRLGARRPLGHGPRPRLTAVSLDLGQLTVSLTEGDSVWLGAVQASDPPTAHDAAQGTVLAVRGLLGPGCEPRLSSLVEVELAGRPAHLAVIELAQAEGEATLLGAALVGGDPLLSAARAVLDAVNRKLQQPGPLLRRETTPGSPELTQGVKGNAEAAEQAEHRNRRRPPRKG